MKGNQTMMITRIIGCTPLKNNFRGLGPKYPSGRGNVDKYRDDVMSGAIPPPDNDPADHVNAEKERKEMNDWQAIWFLQTGGDDGDDWADDDC